MNPTETLQLVSHRGWLFAGQSSKGSRPYPTVLGSPPPEWSGAQILIKTSSVAPWMVDHTIGLSPYPFHLRVEVLKELRIATDGNGNPVNLPHGILASGLSDIGETGAKQASVRMRDDNTGLWKQSHVTTANEEAFPVSFVSRQEAGVTRVYTGLSNGQIHRGAYSSNERNLIWDTNAQFGGIGPVLGLAEANSVLYAAGGLVQVASNSPVNGGIYMRNDTNKTWQLVYRWPYPTDLYGQSNEVRLMQSLTAVPEPHGEPYQVLLATRFWPGIIERIDPKKGHQVTTELDLHDFLAKQWNDERWRKASIRLASQGFTSTTNPVTGERAHLTGLWAESPDPVIRPARGPTFLLRFLDGTYQLASGAVPGQTNDLRATRCIAQSPFLDDPGALYLGGYDILEDTNANTGWILRGAWLAWPKLFITAPNLPEWQLEWESTDTPWMLERNSSLDLLSPWQTVPGLSTRSNTNQTQSIPPQDPGSFYRLRKL